MRTRTAVRTAAAPEMHDAPGTPSRVTAELGPRSPLSSSAHHPGCRTRGPISRLVVGMSRPQGATISQSGSAALTASNGTEKLGPAPPSCLPDVRNRARSWQKGGD